MGDSFTSPAMPGLGELDASAFVEMPLGMDRFAVPGRGLIRWRGQWRMVIGSPAWGFFYGRAPVQGWDAPGQEWNTPSQWPVSGKGNVTTDPASRVPTLDAGLDAVLNDDMANTTTTDFAVTPGSVANDATTGSFSSQGAGVAMTTSARGDTQAVVSSGSKTWWDWIPWFLLLGAVGIALKGRSE